MGLAVHPPPRPPPKPSLRRSAGVALGSYFPPPTAQRARVSRVSIDPVVLLRLTGLALEASPHPILPPPAPALVPVVVPVTPPAPVEAPESPPPSPSPPVQPVVAQRPAVRGSSSSLGSVGACIRWHESGDNYSANTGNGYYGAWQFLPSTWNEAMTTLGFPAYANGRADLAPPWLQNQAAVWLHSTDGWNPWPQTSVMCGV